MSNRFMLSVKVLILDEIMIIPKYLLIALIFIPFVAHSQQLIVLTSIQDGLKETSGLIYLDNTLITINDSRGKAHLYELDSITGEINRTVAIKNASNVDWESLCNDSSYIYIGDIGNNSGSRTDLKVYRISINDFFTTENDTVIADTIRFEYLDQIDFTSTEFSTNYDAEALISCNDSLYIFTKNWGDFKTNIYALPKTPGDYQIQKTDSIITDGLITGATCNAFNERIFLSGYGEDGAFILEFYPAGSQAFSAGMRLRYPLDIPEELSIQVESICFVNKSSYYLTAEESTTGTSALFKFTSESIAVNTKNKKIKQFAYPNPVSQELRLPYLNGGKAELYNLHGVLTKSSQTGTMLVDDLAKGLYLLVLKNGQEEIISNKKIMVQ